MKKVYENYWEKVRVKCMESCEGDCVWHRQHNRLRQEIRRIVLTNYAYEKFKSLVSSKGKGKFKRQK